jgi:hypothetical protein
MTEELVKRGGGQVLLAAQTLSDAQKQQPEWLWYENETFQTSLGRWQKHQGQAPYVRADIYTEASARITALSAEVERLRRIIESIINERDIPEPTETTRDVCEAAKAYQAKCEAEYHEVATRADAAEAALASAKEDNARLRSALAPFARFIDDIDAENGKIATSQGGSAEDGKILLPDDTTAMVSRMFSGVTFSYGDLRRARTALGETK